MENFGKAMQSGAEGHTVGEAGPDETLGYTEHEKKYAYDISLPVLVEQYEKLKEYEAIISGDIRGKSEEGRLSKIARGRELFEEIKRGLKLNPDASYAEVTAERENLHTYLSSIGMASDDGR